jgi:chemotaxis protein MotA
MIIEGLIAIQNGENPHFIEQRLRSYLPEDHAPDKKKG